MSVYRAPARPSPQDPNGPEISSGPVEDLAADRQVLDRLCNRLRSLSEAALTQRRDTLDAASAAAAVHRLCTWAAAEQGIEAAVPRLHPLASGDQLAVIGREFLTWAESASGASAVAALAHWRGEVDRLRAAT